MRASAGTLAVVRSAGTGSRPVYENALPTTAYLMEGERCTRDCAFCAQARSAGSRADLLSRVNWPEIDRPQGTGAPAATGSIDDFWSGLARAVDDGRLKRACFQVTQSRGALTGVEAGVRTLHTLRPQLPICVSYWPRSIDELERILRWGASTVTLALDAATPGVYRRTKDGSFRRAFAFLREAAQRYPGRIASHLIAGLGETEEEMVWILQNLRDLGVPAGLFAFTPVPGTAMAGRASPDLYSYRRLQVARFLITRGEGPRAGDMVFDSGGRLASYGWSWAAVARLLRGDGDRSNPGACGLAFRTSGCPDCNRPYYNERPSGPLYNYPRDLAPEEVERAVREAMPAGEENGSTGQAAMPAGEENGSTGKETQVWRLLIESAPRGGPENMAVDEAILRAHAEGKVPPTLRFYRWSPPALSLGYFQDARREADVETCRRLGVSVVRRLTGGRAVLHDREVTYSVVVSMDRFPGTVVETYRKLAAGLIRGLQELGYEAALAPERSTPGGPGSPYGACFEVPSSYEIVVGGRKVIGSAQVRRLGVILQHGSILLELDAGVLAQTLGFPPEAADRIASKATGLSQVSGAPARACRFETVCQAMVEGFEASLGVTLQAGRLTAEEAATARRLVGEKYGRDDWNLRMPRTPAAEGPSREAGR